ncbi:hypothetical protein [Afipia sp. DC4300-2b1]|uniref:hypothetical protein n=1 Tax=Afipia sp. DC4300-2b1 TaxID=2804672 RepID=UPI003CE86FEE
MTDLSPARLSKGEVLDGLYALIDALNAIPPRPKKVEISFGDSERGRAVLACFAVAKFLENFVANRTDAHKIFTGLGVALVDLENGTVDPMLQKAKRASRSPDPSNLWILRGLIVRYMLAKKITRQEDEKAASSTLYTKLKNPEVLVSASSGKASSSSITSSFEKWSQVLKSGERLANTPAQIAFNQWRVADAKTLQDLNASERERWLGELVDVIQEQIDMRLPPREPKQIVLAKKPGKKKKSKKN